LTQLNKFTSKTNNYFLRRILRYALSAGTAVIILNLGIRWRWGISFTSRPLYLWRRSPWYHWI